MPSLIGIDDNIPRKGFGVEGTSAGAMESVGSAHPTPMRAFLRTIQAVARV